ncbi:putative glycoside hydrolase family 61 protein [Neofusicoccum parvum UCRNP2]|uniref:AA9 family lytic polysaccharide monooxygenase n=1 Tax=Botryosphaeria parva (strain UCR-NP2) TaxID=1287680 RepID=R1GMU4_BOTPV|nr:putative glycoside hydrolase family 61 protein [Neofusicoccum parvum UCRNP2]
MRSILSISALVAAASAHTIFQELWVNGVSQGHTTGIRVPNYDGPITDVTSNDVICNGGVNPLNTPLPSAVIDTAMTHHWQSQGHINSPFPSEHEPRTRKQAPSPALIRKLGEPHSDHLNPTNPRNPPTNSIPIQIPAGATVTAEWHHTLAGYSATDGDDPISASHKGPVIAYLAKVPDATAETVTGLSWFKIYADGLDGASGTWAVDKLIDNKGKVDFTIPKCIPAGNYLLRVEIIALHGASTYPGAQLYMECAQINVSGGTGTSVPSGVSFPGAYKTDDPGIVFNLYYPTPTAYTIPGPTVLTC